MIRAYAIEPEAVLAWTDKNGYRFIKDKFGLGTSRMFLDIQKYSKWKKKAYDAAQKNGLGDMELLRLQELFKLWEIPRVKNRLGCYDNTISWLTNSRKEYDRHPFAAIIASSNPDKHPAVIVEEELGQGNDYRWECSAASTPRRNAKELAGSIRNMLENSSVLHLVDQYFSTHKLRHKEVLEEFLNVAMYRCKRQSHLDVTVHCNTDISYDHFNRGALELKKRLPKGIHLSFKRWKEAEGKESEKFHNRYILSDLGGLVFGTGLDRGYGNQTEDINLMDKEQYRKRWEQFVDPAEELTLVDSVIF